MKVITLAVLMTIAPVVYATAVLDIESKDSSERQIYHNPFERFGVVVWASICQHRYEDIADRNYYSV